MQPKKFDNGKLKYHLFPVEVHEQVIQRFMIGAEKYGEPEDGTPNWRQGEGHNPNRLIDAIYRHLAEYRKGKLIDPENGSPHLVAIICNAIMLQDLDNNKSEDNG